MTTKKERAEALARMTKAELIKTIKTLDARQVKLLNEVDQWKAKAAVQQAIAVATMRDAKSKGDTSYTLGVAFTEPPPPLFPWETALADTVTYEATSGKPICRKEEK